ncbi:2-C-methyl-D-erythritol 4-phosphate cytidylyltransferase, partial [Bordetella pertussis]|uniref:2-C-methyl-D-erythritol 4-phosphate cytidylyltransferase n=1 Tax=Bordetella pertussis TaxID=520 RepID=UPI000A7644DD
TRWPPPWPTAGRPPTTGYWCTTPPGRGARAAGLAVTDEASAVEAAGHAPRLVAGALRNFKVTWPDDFELMEKWL